MLEQSLTVTEHHRCDEHENLVEHARREALPLDVGAGDVDVLLPANCGFTVQIALALQPQFVILQALSLVAAVGARA